MVKDNNTRYVLLGLLSHEPLSGYDIKKRIDQSISQFWNVGYGQIYPTLALLEKEGLIERILSENAKGPQRNVFAITNKGHTLLEQWLLQPEEKEYTRYEILLKMFFSGKLDTAVSIQRIRAFQKRYEPISKMMALYADNLKTVMDMDPDHKHFFLTVRFGEYVYKAYLDWAEEALSMLSADEHKKTEEQNHE